MVMSKTEIKTPKTNLRSKLPALTWLLFSVSLGDLVLSIKLFQNASSWQAGLSLFISSLALSFVIIGIIFLLRESRVRATQVFISSICMRSLSLGILFINLGLTAQIYMLVTSTIILLEWQSINNTAKAILWIGIASLLPLTADLIQPGWRLPGLLSSSTLTNIVILFVMALFLLLSLKSFSKYSIQAKLIMIFLALTGISVLIISFVNYNFSVSSVTEEARYSLQSASQGLAVQIDNFIRSNLELIQSEAASPELYRLLALDNNVRLGSDEEKLVKFVLNEFLNRNSTYVESYALVDATGKSVVDTSLVSNVDRSLHPYFLIPRTTGIPYVSPILISEAGENFVIYFSAPVRNKEKEVVGVLRVRYTIDILQNMVSAANGLGGESSFGVLVDEYDIILAHGYEPELINRPLSQIDTQTRRTLENNLRLSTQSAPLDDAELQNQIKQALKGGFFLSNIIGKIDEPGAVYLSPIRYQTWKVAYFQPQRAFLALVRSQTNIVILLAEAIALLIILIGGFAARIFTEPIINLTKTANELAQGNLTAKSKINTRDEIGVLANTFNVLSIELSATLGSLEHRVEERTRAIETSVHIGSAISTILDQDKLVLEVVNELQRAFLYYHVNIYLANHKAHKMELVAGTGEAGQRMVEQGHFIQFGQGLVGKVADSGVMYSVSDTRSDPNWLQNSLLPDTHSEIAVPILLGSELIGVLDVQQDKVNGISQQDTELLQMIASQVAIAIRNASHYQQTQKQMQHQQSVLAAIERINSSSSPSDALTIAIQEVSQFVGYRPTIARIRLIDDGLENSTDEIFLP